MKFNIKALALACAILWGGAVLVVALANLIWSCYAVNFLQLLASFYPGYHAAHNIPQVALVTLDATADGLIGGALFGWLYNCFAGSCCCSKTAA